MSSKDIVICATDLSNGGERAVDLASAIAEPLGMALEVVVVTDTASMAPLPESANEAERGLYARARKRLDGTIAALEDERSRISRPSLEVRAQLLDGRPWEAIVARAREIGAALIVVGPHGQGGPRALTVAEEWILGTTADRVVRYAPCPVLVAAHEGAVPRIKGGKIVVGVDFEEPCRRAFAVALRWAAKLEAAVHAVHVLPNPRILPRDDEPDPGSPAREAEARTRLAALVKELRVQMPGSPEVGASVVRGEPATALSDTAEAEGATMIVIGTHGRSGVTGAFLGSVAERTLRRAEVPVLCLRE